MASRPVLLIALPSLDMGGAEQFLTALANQFNAEFDVHFYIFSNKLKLQDRLDYALVHANPNPFTAALGLRKITRSIKPDVILSTIVDLNLLILALCFLYPKKTKIIVREAVDPEAAMVFSKHPKLATFFYRRLYPRADRILCLSKNMQKSTLRLLAPAHPKIEIISNGVGTHRQLPLPITRSTTNTILAVGRLYLQKGYDQLIKAFYQFIKLNKKRNYQLVILGEGNQQLELEKIIFDLNLTSSVHLKGLVDDPTPYYATSSFLALPSRYEGVSNVMIEALVNGLPVLATRDRTSAECYVDDSNGVLIDTCNEQEILEGLRKMDAKLDRIDRNAMAKKWRKELSLSVIAERYSTLIKEVITEHSIL